jgi:hypothetical protein
MSELHEIFIRFWSDLMSRPEGPYGFRFALQPVMAIIMATLDGIKDARTGRSPYFRTIIFNPEKRTGRLLEGLRSTTRILLLGLAMELLYQFKVLHTFYINEAIVVIFVLAFLPYLLLRGPIERIARHWIESKKNKA